MISVRTPQEIKNINYLKKPKIFLCGSISRGKFRDKIIEGLKNEECVIYDPRYENPKLPPEEFAIIINKWADFHIKESDIIVFWLNKSSKQQITMFELGKFAGARDKYIIAGIEKGHPRGKDIEVQLLLLNNPGIYIKQTVEEIIDTVKKCLLKINVVKDEMD